MRWWKVPHNCGRSPPDQAPPIITLLCAKATARSESASTTRDQAAGGVPGRASRGAGFGARSASDDGAKLEADREAASICRVTFARLTLQPNKHRNQKSRTDPSPNKHRNQKSRTDPSPTPLRPLSDPSPTPLRPLSDPSPT